MAAALPNTVEVLSSLRESLDAARSVLPIEESVLPPENGISLLDVKNELFLSYLQSLALRNLSVIQSMRKFLPSKDTSLAEALDPASPLQDKIVDNLVRQRLYLEKGVRPLEDRLKYTIDKALRAAEEQDRQVQGQAQRHQVSEARRNGRTKDDSTGDSDSDADSTSSGEELNALALAPNAASMMRNVRSKDADTGSRARDEKKSGVYRPPRITATTMPESRPRDARDKERFNRSRTLDEYVTSELAEAPTAQPSVGANVAQGGRRQISARERAKEQERRDYEETYLMRLPKESKKERGKNRPSDGGFGGEDWRGLGDGLERIDSLTRGVKRKDKEGALEKSRKRRATEDGQRGDGLQGGVFEKRRKKMAKKLK